MPANFNDATAHQTFPTLSITDEEAKAASSPTVGAPGFIVEQPDGTWEWVPNMTAAKEKAGNTGAIFQSWAVCDYFKQFAREETIDPKTGKEVDEGPLQ
ncbi:hypothetical protein ACOALA_04040 [Alicyclobacillus acidoterrestris]|uniref:hypothetical protein n=1 Tax=Alicyclobacillus acidoterrestris TaxID=1450 RepID=UPI003F530FF7